MQQEQLVLLWKTGPNMPGVYTVQDVLQLVKRVN